MNTRGNVMLKDGNLSFEGGVDSNTPASLLNRNQLASATNSTGRQGTLKPRPGFRKRTLTLPATIASAFKDTRFQHGSFYDGNGSPALLSSHGGRLFKIDLYTWAVSEITPTGYNNSDTLTMGWSVQAENYWIYQDNQSLPVIFDGTNSRRSNQSRKEVPVGNVMAYTMGRLIVALPDGYSYRAGDLVFGPSGTASLNYKDACLRFTENDYLNEGGDLTARVFGAPSGYGPITAMKPLAMMDTQLGQGPLLIGTPNVIFTVNLPFDRTTWKDLTNPMQTVTPVIGPVSQSGTVSQNTDIWYRDVLGIRSFITARRDFQTWANTPMSNEIASILDYDTPHLLQHASAVVFDNRMLTTVSPVPSEHGVWHRGLVALDFNPVSGIGRKAAPVWDGAWSGLRVLQLVTGLVDKKERCFIYALSNENEIELWEIVPTDKFDNSTVRIIWSIDLPSYHCGDPHNFKKLETARMVVDNLTGQFDIALQYRTDQDPCLHPWDTRSVCAAYQDCGPDTCDGPVTYQTQIRNPITFRMPPDTFDTINNRKWRTGFEFQPHIDMTGYAEIKRFRIYALDETESLNAERSLP